MEAFEAGMGEVKVLFDVEMRGRVNNK